MPALPLPDQLQAELSFRQRSPEVHCIWWSSHPEKTEMWFHGFIASLLQGSEEQWTCSHIRTYGIDRSFYLVHDDTPLPHRECLYFTANALYQHSLLSPADLKRTHPTHSLPLILHQDFSHTCKCAGEILHLPHQPGKHNKKYLKIMCQVNVPKRVQF